MGMDEYDHSAFQKVCSSMSSPLSFPSSPPFSSWSHLPMTLPRLSPHESCTTSRPNWCLSLQPGSYCWLEIPVLDIDRAKSFYGKLFGWDFTPPSAMGLPDEGTYLIFSKKGTAAHGGLQLVKPDDLVAPKEKGHSAVKITITGESIDATLAEAEKAGGGIVE